MTIDEIIKYIVYEECEHCAGLFCKQNKGCRYWNILEMLRELQWYREQDLIRRDVALSRTEDVYFAACTESEKSWKCYLYDNCGECKTHQVELEIEQIPKAEYRGDDNDTK